MNNTPVPKNMSTEDEIAYRLSLDKQEFEDMKAMYRMIGHIRKLEEKENKENHES